MAKMFKSVRLFRFGKDDGQDGRGAAKPKFKTAWKELHGVPLTLIRNDALADAPAAPAPVAAAGQTAAEPIMAETLWQDRPVLFVLVRRPGCLLCREEAYNLSFQRQLIRDQLGIRMVAIVNQELGAREFADAYWRGECYMDSTFGIFKAMGEGKVRRASVFAALMPSVISRILRAMKSGLDHNFEGDASMLGGLLLVGPRDYGVVYEYPETEFGDFAPQDEVLDVCRQLAEDVAKRGTAPVSTTPWLVAESKPVVRPSATKA
ncbi:hypothetical protein AMAG_12181 [Allomyces macrogynus ATCC 38327]|uniref:Peroxiredoxin-like 2A n=1 Tax=Allomyces macrogynus (strain ATCC 38327) TaxID=578462 RepID=A0A0L0SXQ6_ALLM3|nr:hypothetical protein AMAG_12181 [Allomyces macrogynus ATCC 38327]|eukprot:KNE67104.1 hypothetical protein AMAG_12181 [Allomyces macrogynus ATCC 38327]